MIIIIIIIVPGLVAKPPEVLKDTLTSTSAVLVWSIPDDPNGIITGYRVLIKTLSTDPMQFNFMMMTGGVGDRRKRQVPNIITECIKSGIMDNVTLNATGTSHSVSNLSKCRF